MDRKISFGAAFMRLIGIGCILILQVSCAGSTKRTSSQRDANDEIQEQLVKEEVINGNAVALMYGPHSYMWVFIKQGGRPAPSKPSQN